MMTRVCFVRHALVVGTTLLLAIFFLSPNTAHAQLGLDVFGANLTLTTAPVYPSPNQSVRLSVQSLLLDLASSDITWYADNVVVANGVGLTETIVTTGSLGSATNIRVEARRQGTSAVAEGIIRPTEVEILWESDSYVPPFYRGRALPSAGSNVRLFSVSRFQYTGTQSTVSPDKLIYTWKKNNKILKSISGLGSHTVLLEGPVLFGTDNISVEIKTADNSLRGFASIRISSVEPYLALYEEHPVFGVLYHNALGSRASVPETEATFVVVPYFAPVRNPDDGFLQYEWSINRTDIASSPTHPSAITINAEGSSGLASIELALTHATNFFLSVSRTWNITLAGAGDSGFSNPFRSSNP